MLNMALHCSRHNKNTRREAGTQEPQVAEEKRLRPSRQSADSNFKSLPQTCLRTFETDKGLEISA